MKTSLFLAALAAFTTAGATENPLWMRYCSISPDGSTIAFCYKGDIYTVPSTGGNARQLTTNPAHDTHPIWSLMDSRLPLPLLAKEHGYLHCIQRRRNPQKTNNSFWKRNPCHIFRRYTYFVQGQPDA